MSSPNQNAPWYDSKSSSGNTSGNTSSANSGNTSDDDNDNNSNEELLNLIKQIEQILEENDKPTNCAVLPKMYSEKYNKKLSNEINNLFQIKRIF